MTWAIKKIKRAVAEVVIGGEAADSDSAFTLEHNLTKVAATVPSY